MQKVQTVHDACARAHTRTHAHTHAHTRARAREPQLLSNMLRLYIYFVRP